MTHLPPQEPRIAEFLRRLSRLDTGGRAQLKRKAGRALSECSEVMGLFYSLLPAGVPERDQERYFVVATLWPWVSAGVSGNLGQSLRRLRTKGNAPGLDRRFEILLDADETQLVTRLSRCVRLIAATKASPIDWAVLLKDLLAWDHPERYVQRRWAQSYFGIEPVHAPKDSIPNSVNA